jgi:hypothetical protein
MALEAVDRRRFYVEALEDAAAAAGGVPQLSRVIGVPVPTLREWLSGKECPPLKAFLSALDVIAADPYARGRIAASAVERNFDGPRADARIAAANGVRSGTDARKPLSGR